MTRRDMKVNVSSLDFQFVRFSFTDINALVVLIRIEFDRILSSGNAFSALGP